MLPTSAKSSEHVFALFLQRAETTLQDRSHLAKATPITKQYHVVNGSQESVKAKQLLPELPLRKRGRRSYLRQPRANGGCLSIIGSGNEALRLCERSILRAPGVAVLVNRH